MIDPISQSKLFNFAIKEEEEEEEEEEDEEVLP